MATYLPNVTDNSQPVPFFQLDYNFLHQSMQQADSQYQQGFDELKSDYSAVLNSQVTGPKAEEVKQQYINNAQESLKKVSASDLSLPQNVQQAEAAFSPFWKDKTLLRNMAATKNLASAESQYYSDYNSTDKKIRDTANPTALEAIQWSKQDLANLPWDQQSYQNFRPMGYVRVEDLNAKALTAWKEASLKGVTTTDANGGPAMVVTENGPKTKENYMAWWISQNGGPEHDAQFQMFAYVDHHRKMAAVKQQYPGIDDASANKLVAQDYVDQRSEYYKTAIDSYTKNLGVAKSSYDAIIAKGSTNVSQEERRQAESYAMQIAQNQKAIDDYTANYTKEFGYVPGKDGKPGEIDTNSDAYKKTMNGMLYHSQDYMSDVLKLKQAGDWAAGFASISSEKKELDPTWKPIMDHQVDMAKLAQGEERLGIMAEHYNNQDFDRAVKQGGLEYAKALYGDSHMSDYNAYVSAGGQKGTGEIDLGSGRIQQGDDINVQKITPSVDTLQTALATQHNNVVQSIYNPDGVISQVLSTRALGNDIGLSDSELAIFSNASLAGMTGKQPTPEQATVISKVKAALKSNGIDADAVKGPQGLMYPITQLIPAVVKKYESSLDKRDMAALQQLQGQYDIITHSLATYNKNMQNFNAAVQKKIFTDPKYSKLYGEFTDPATGQKVKRLYTVDDMAPDFPKLTVQDKNGNIKIIDPKEFARSYKEGTFNINGATEKVSINGEEYTPLAVGSKKPEDYGTHWWDSKHAHANEVINDLNSRVGVGGEFESGKSTMWKDGNGPTDRVNKAMLSGTIRAKYGKSKDIPLLSRKAGNEVSQNMSGVKDGIVGSIDQFDLTDDSNKSQQNTGIALVQASFVPDNYEKIYWVDDKGTQHQVTDSQLSDLTSIMAKKDIQNNFGTAAIHNIGPNGKMAVEIVPRGFNDQGTSAASVKTVGSTPIEDLLRHRLYVDVSPGAKSPLLNSIPRKQEMFIYGDALSSGQSIKSDPVASSFGFNYEIIPGPKTGDGLPSYVRITTTHYQIDKNTGLIVTGTDGKPIVEQGEATTVNLADANIDEIVKATTMLGNSYYNNVFQLRSAYAAQQGATGAGISATELNKQLKAKYNFK